MGSEMCIRDRDIKNRTVSNPPMLDTVGTSAEGIAPRHKSVAITFLGPYRSTAGPAKIRTIAVPPRDAKLLYVTSENVVSKSMEVIVVVNIREFVRFRSFLTASVIRGAKANQEKKAEKKPRVAIQKAIE